MTDEEIMEFAYRVWDAGDGACYIGPGQQSLCEFARLIMDKQKEIDAGIADEFKHPLLCITIDGRARLAAAIRNQK